MCAQCICAMHHFNLGGNNRREQEYQNDIKCTRIHTHTHTYAVQEAIIKLRSHIKMCCLSESCCNYTCSESTCKRNEALC